jgi:hypothetical protein
MPGPSWHSACSYVREAAQMIGSGDSLDADRASRLDDLRRPPRREIDRLFRPVRF